MKKRENLKFTTTQNKILSEKIMELISLTTLDEHVNKRR